MTRPEAFDRSYFRAFSQITTRWFDNDVYGHMNNAMHYQLFDTAVNGHLVAKGVLDPVTSPTVFLVVETGCTYLGEIGFRFRPEVNEASGTPLYFRHTVDQAHDQ